MKKEKKTVGPNEFVFDVILTLVRRAFKKYAFDAVKACLTITYKLTKEEKFQYLLNNRPTEKEEVCV